MPPNTVYVGRPTKWGNPFRVGGYYMRGDPEGNRGWMTFAYTQAAPDYADARFTEIKTEAQAVEWFRWFYTAHPRDLTALRGKTLACWCQLDQPCHADVLLELANGEASS